MQRPVDERHQKPRRLSKHPCLTARPDADGTPSHSHPHGPSEQYLGKDWSLVADTQDIARRGPDDSSLLFPFLPCGSLPALHHSAVQPQKYVGSCAIAVCPERKEPRDASQDLTALETHRISLTISVCRESK